jgi:serine/threonine protein kinase
MSGHSLLLDPVTEVVIAYENAWKYGRPRLEDYLAKLSPADQAYGLAELVRVDLKEQYGRGQSPAARDYFDRFPELTQADGRALSLIYEEYCLRVEKQGPIDTELFCDRYSTWRNSLVSQLAYHKVLGKREKPAASHQPFPEAGDFFGSYELIELLGQGGAARVFRAIDHELGKKECVLKISEDRGGESAILGRLDHEHIVPVNAAMVDSLTGFRGLCMPYYPGMTLDRVIRRFRAGTFPRSAHAFREVVHREFPDLRVSDNHSRGWNQYPTGKSYAYGVAWIGQKLSEALVHAHAKGVFHRDVKPENVLLTFRDGPQLLDFNLAHDSNIVDQAHAAHRGGTLPYMAREHLQAFQNPTLWKQVGAPADIFSLGLILRELLTLKPVDRPNSDHDLPRAIDHLVQKRGARLESIRAVNPQVPHGLEAIIHHCLAEAPENRYRSGEELAEDFRRFLTGRPLRYVRNPSIVEVSKNWVVRKLKPAALLAGAALLAFGTSALWNRQSPTPITTAISVAPPKPERKPELVAPKIDVERTDLINQAIEANSLPLLLGLARKPEFWPTFRQMRPMYNDSSLFLKCFASGLSEGNDSALLPEAESMLRDARKLEPTNMRLLDDLTSVEFRQNKLIEAVNDMNKGIQDLIDAKVSSRSPEFLRIRVSQARYEICLGDALCDNLKHSKHCTNTTHDETCLLLAQQNGRKYLHDAIAHIKIAQEPDVQHLPPAVRTRSYYFLTLAEVALSDVEEKRGHPEEAVKKIKDAREHYQILKGLSLQGANLGSNDVTNLGDHVVKESLRLSKPIQD